MFVVVLTYKKLISIKLIDKYLDEHKTFLDNEYKNNSFIASGVRNPRNGGIIISQLKNRKKLEDIIKQDPFHLHRLADYEIIEFTPSKYHPDFASFLA